MPFTRFPRKPAARAALAILALLLTARQLVAAEQAMGILPLDAAELPRDMRLHFELSAPAGGVIHFGERFKLPFSPGLSHDVMVEHPFQGAPMLQIWKNGKFMRGPEDTEALSLKVPRRFLEGSLPMSGDFSAALRFATLGDGILLAQCPADGSWGQGAKALGIRKGTLEFHVNGMGAISGGPVVTDGREHRVVIVCHKGAVKIWLDGMLAAEKAALGAADPPGALLQSGRSIPGVGGELQQGWITRLEGWRRALAQREIATLFEGDGKAANTPDFRDSTGEDINRPRIEVHGDAKIVESWLQPLESRDHAAIIRRWDERSLKAGRVIYHSACVVCHGTREMAGTLPTARRFATDAFKNGSDPYSMFRTLTHGFGAMPPQPQYNEQQKYAVIHYIREEFLKPHNPSQYTELTPDYLKRLPKARMKPREPDTNHQGPPPYERMDFGPAMFWTYQLQKGQIAQKGIAVRLDEGPGGVSKGKAWMIYDHDTMRLAAITTGRFIDWRGIAFDGSHGSHTSLAGERQLINPSGPGWASPQGTWDDPRPLGRDGKPYGPLPREWATYEGIHLNGDKVVLATRVAGTRVLESPGWIERGDSPLFVRTLQVGAATGPLRLRVAPATAQVELDGDGSLAKENGNWIATLPGGARTRLWIARDATTPIARPAKGDMAPIDLEALTHGGAARFGQRIETQSQAGSGLGAFAVDTYPLPLDNPWSSWMRPTGFDFTPDGRAAVLATWNGDLWRVEGLMDPAPATLRWQRIASGLFQPLGVKFRGQDLFVTCRDQLARMVDLNGDHEIDFIECFNNDHQVTEHFHEFAMALQTDAAGNFYYAKSARHALPAVVPQHGTVLRVSADGSRTDIIATGLRAANGMCVNDDGTFYVTDQEGHWTPKNRIDLIIPGRFYGNMLGYTDVTDAADSAMEPPVVWIDEIMDRSPAELVRVPGGVWGGLGGGLLNLSYGTGRVYALPLETCKGRLQGAMTPLPIPALPTGIMRGRFGADGALYACGMVGWASNASTEGGFHRIRRTGNAAHLPLAVQAMAHGLRLTFSDPLDRAALQPQNMIYKCWSILRTEYYGSRRHKEQLLAISGLRLLDDQRTVELDIPGIAPVDCYELTLKLRTAEGDEIQRTIQGTIHRLADE